MPRPSRRDCTSIKLPLMGRHRTHKSLSSLNTLLVQTTIMLSSGEQKIRVRFHIFRNARIKTVCKYQSCMVSKLRIIWKQTVAVRWPGARQERCACTLSFFLVCRLPLLIRIYCYLCAAAVAASLFLSVPLLLDCILIVDWV